MALETFTFETSMGEVKEYFGHPLHFLSDQEKKDLNQIGYSGKLNGKQTCINSEKHYKKDSVVNQLSKIMVDHFNIIGFY